MRVWSGVVTDTKRSRHTLTTNFATASGFPLGNLQYSHITLKQVQAYVESVIANRGANGTRGQREFGRGIGGPVERSARVSVLVAFSFLELAIGNTAGYTAVLPCSSCNERFRSL